MRSREELGRAMAETNPQRGGREAGPTEVDQYNRDKLLLEVFLDVRQLLREDSEKTWIGVQVEDQVPDPV